MITHVKNVKTNKHLPIGLIYLIDFSKLEHKRCACYDAVVAY